MTDPKKTAFIITAIIAATIILSATILVVGINNATDKLTVPEEKDTPPIPNSLVMTMDSKSGTVYLTNGGSVPFTVSDKVIMQNNMLVITKYGYSTYYIPLSNIESVVI